jgi:hypothetical protein
MSRADPQNPPVALALTPMATAAHHPPMRSFLSLLALAGAFGLAAGCGPQEAFCPNTGVDGGPVCPVNGDDAMLPTMDMGSGSLCPSGQYFSASDNECLCSSNSMPPPCP